MSYIINTIKHTVVSIPATPTQLLPEQKVITDPKQLMEMKIGELTEIYNMFSLEPVKKFKDKETAVTRVAAILKDRVANPNAKATPEGGATVKKGAKERTPRVESKQSKLVAFIAKHKKFTWAEGMEASGYDEKNLRTVVWILASNRTPPENRIKYSIDRKAGQVTVE